ncbi:MAG: IS630 family transposase [Rubripirellula sp.]
MPILNHLNVLIRSPLTPKVISQRAELVYYQYSFPSLLNPKSVAEVVGVTPETASKHLHRFEASVAALELICREGTAAQLARTIEDCLQDAPRSGRSPTFTPVQIVSIISLACEKPEAYGRPVSKWTSREIAEEVIKQNIVPSISESHVRRILRSVNLRPHRIKGWCFTTEKDKEAFEKQVKRVCDTYLDAQENFDQERVHTVSVDEATGIQANEKRDTTLPPQPDEVGKEETQYTRHGSLCLIAAWHVVLGQVIHHAVQKTRTNEDFAKFIEDMVATAPEDPWVIVVDNLNIHCSELLVRWIAKLEGIDEKTLGSKQKRTGILGSVKSRKKFLSDRSHRIRFVYTPKHSSWLNQIEVIFGIIKRRALANESFQSQQALMDRLNQFISYYNENFAKPINWTYTGRPTDAKVEATPLTWREKRQPKKWSDYWKNHQQTLAV